MAVLWLLFLGVAGCTASPQLSCTGANEEATTCMSLCPQLCNISYADVECRNKCEPGCDCKPGFSRDITGTCIDNLLCEQHIDLECDPDEIEVPCKVACPKKLCNLIKFYPYICARVINNNEKSNGIAVEYECPFGDDPSNIPSILISQSESTIVGVDYPYPTKYKRPEINEYQKTVTYFAPFLSEGGVEID